MLYCCAHRSIRSPHFTARRHHQPVKAYSLRAVDGFGAAAVARNVNRFN